MCLSSASNNSNVSFQLQCLPSASTRIRRRLHLLIASGVLCCYCSHVESVSWCLSEAHLAKGLISVVHQSSVTVCHILSNASDVTLTQLYSVNFASTPRSKFAEIVFCFLFGYILCCSHSDQFNAVISFTVVYLIYLFSIAGTRPMTPR